MGRKNLAMTFVAVDHQKDLSLKSYDFVEIYITRSDIYNEVKDI